MRVIARFPDSRPDPPDHAEQHLLSDHERSTVNPSSIIPRHNIRSFDFHCPSCQLPLPIHHGDRIQCTCGLYMENYGNSLVVWQEENKVKQGMRYVVVITTTRRLLVRAKGEPGRSGEVLEDIGGARWVEEVERTQKTEWTGETFND